MSELREYSESLQFLREYIFPDMDSTQLQEMINEIDSNSGFNTLTYNSYFFIQGTTTFVIVDERGKDNSHETVRQDFIQSGILQKEVGNNAGSLYSDYEKVSEILSNFYVTLFAGIGTNMTIIVVQDRDRFYQFDGCINAILASLNNIPVYFVAQRNTGVSIAKNSQYSMFKIMSSCVNSDIPYYLKLNYFKMYTKNRPGLLYTSIGNIQGMHEYCMSTRIESVKQSGLVFYDLDVLDSCINITYEQDSTSVEQFIDVDIFNVLSCKPKPTVFTSFTDGISFHSPLSLLTEFKSKIFSEANKIVLQKVLLFSQRTNTPYIISVNSRYITKDKNVILSSVARQIFQQYCNLLSEFAFDSNTPVFLRDVCIASYDSKMYIGVQKDYSQIIKAKSLGYVNTPTGTKEFTRTGELNNNIIFVNNPMFTGNQEWDNFTEEEIDTLVKILFYNITEYSDFNDVMKTIESMSEYTTDSTFSDNVNVDFRRLLSYHTKLFTENLIVENLLMLPESYESPYIDCFGLLGYGSVTTMAEKQNIFI